MLEAVEVSKKYWDRSSGRQYDVLQSCSLQIAAGEAVGMMGPSGCGKSTLARVLQRPYHLSDAGRDSAVSETAETLSPASTVHIAAS